MLRAFFPVAVWAVTVFAVAAPVSAQIQAPPAPSRPYRGLFAGNLQPSAHSLVLTGAMGAGFSTAVVDFPSGSGPSAPPRTGQFASGNGSLRYNFAGDTLRFGANVNANGRYYGSDTDPLFGTYAARAFLSTTFGSRTTLTLTQQAGQYEQNLAYYTPNGLGGGLVDPNEVPIDTETFRTSNSEAQLMFRVTKRVTASVDYRYHTADVFTVGGPGRYHSQSASGSVSVALTKYMSARANYNYGISVLNDPNRPGNYVGRTVDGGLDFGKGLSLGRKARVNFNTGFSGITDLNNHVRYYLVGSGGFSYEIGRSWGTSANYNRTADFDHLLGQPVFVDAASGGLSGMIGRRLNLSTSVGLSRGRVGTDVTSPVYLAGHAGLNAQVGLTRHIGVSASYAFYRYSFGASQTLPAGLVQRLERQTVRVSFDLWVPLLNSRRANASR